MRLRKDCSWSDVGKQLSEDAINLGRSLSGHIFSKLTPPHTTGASDNPTEPSTRGAKEQQVNSWNTLEKFHERDIPPGLLGAEQIQMSPELKAGLEKILHKPVPTGEEMPALNIPPGLLGAEQIQMSPELKAGLEKILHKPVPTGEEMPVLNIRTRSA